VYRVACLPSDNLIGNLTMPKTTKRARHPAKRAAAKRAASANITAWQDDPGSGLDAISRPVPDLSKGPLKYKIKGAAVVPGVYGKGTPQFRYWTAAEALRRGGDFWAPFLGVGKWEPGPVLGVSLDKGVDLNAYYDRTELAFFHQKLGQVTYYSGESPDVVCHEMGHACLDAHRPELWDAPFIEAGAFHESFGDMSAILSALQLPSVRAVALAGIKGYKSSQLSRCAEQLGAARSPRPPSIPTVFATHTTGSSTSIRRRCPTVLRLPSFALKYTPFRGSSPAPSTKFCLGC
jgi:hypothetical protein